MGSHIRLKSGGLFDPLNPDPSLITIEDIAYGLAGQNRYASHSRLTVAQHCVMGSEYLRFDPASLPFLLHDSDEGLGLPDLPAPIKHSPRFAFYDEAGVTLREAVGVRFKVSFSDKMIHFVDRAIRLTEQKFLFGRKLKEGEVALPIQIKEIWSPERAEQEFLQRFHLLTSPTTFTTGEYGKSIGLSRHAALERLTKLEGRGIVERVKVVQNQGGVLRPNVLGWRFISSTLPESSVVSGRGLGFSRETEETLALGPGSGNSRESGVKVVWGGGGGRGEGGDLPSEEVVEDVLPVPSASSLIRWSDGGTD